MPIYRVIAEVEEMRVVQKEERVEALNEFEAAIALAKRLEPGSRIVGVRAARGRAPSNGTSEITPPAAKTRKTAKKRKSVKKTAKRPNARKTSKRVGARA